MPGPSTPPLPFRRWAVTGGTGLVGNNVVRLLVARGAEVAVLARRPPRKEFAGLPVREVPGDLDDEAALADCFAGADVTPNRDAFCGALWDPGKTGLPLLRGAIATLECTVVNRFEAGDHMLFVGRVEAVSLHEDPPRPLLYHGRRYLRIESPAAPDEH